MVKQKHITLFYIIILLFAAAAVSTHTYFMTLKAIEALHGHPIGQTSYLNSVDTTMDFPTVTESHMQYIEGKAPYPLRYRILVPFMVEKFHDWTGIPYYLSYSLYAFLTILTSLIIFFIYLRQWFSESLSVLGCLCITMLLPLTYILFFPNDLMVMLVYFIAALLLTKFFHRFFAHALFWLLIFVGTFNKESTLFLVIFYAVFLYMNYPRRWKENILYLGIAGICFVIPYIVLRIWYGVGPYAGFGVSLNSSLLTIVLLGIFFNSLLLMALTSFSNKPKELRALCLASIPFFLVHWTLGDIGEVRMYTPMFIWLIPMALWHLRNIEEKKK